MSVSIARNQLALVAVTTATEEGVAIPWMVSGCVPPVGPPFVPPTLPPPALTSAVVFEPPHAERRMTDIARHAVRVKTFNISDPRQARLRSLERSSL